MVGAFVDLTLWSIRNRLRTKLRRLRRPRYLIGGIVGLAWFGSVFLRGWSRSANPARHIATPFEGLASHAEMTVFAGALVLCAIALLMAFGALSRPLEFSRAEVQWLFPAPLTRRQILNYKLARSQLGLIFASALMTLLLRPGTLRDGWMFTAGFWIGVTAFRLHSIGVGFARASLSQHGLTGLRRQWPSLLLALVVLAVLGATAAGDASGLAAMSTKREVIEELHRVWSSGAARVVLWPFVTLASLPLSPSPAAFVAGLPGALALVALAYVRVLRADVAFEEAAAAHAEKKAAALTGKAGGTTRVSTPKNRLAPFELALSGRPETAIFWKNLISSGRSLSPRTFLVLLLGAGPFLALLGSRRGPAVGLAAMFVTFAVMVVTMGPLIARGDLRRDLGQLAVIKAWPVSGKAILRGELLAPMVLLVIASWALILAAVVLFGMAPAHGKLAAALASRASFTATAMLVAAAVIMVQLIVQNGLAVLFPAWITMGRTRERGIESMGQGMLTMLGGAVLTALLLAAPTAGAAVTRLALGTRSLVIPAAVLVVLVFVEGLLVTHWLGRVLDRTDLTAIDPVE